MISRIDLLILYFSLYGVCDSGASQGKKIKFKGIGHCTLKFFRAEWGKLLGTIGQKQGKESSDKIVLIFRPTWFLGKTLEEKRHTLCDLVIPALARCLPCCVGKKGWWLNEGKDSN